MVSRLSSGLQGCLGILTASCGLQDIAMQHPADAERDRKVCQRIFMMHKA